MEKSNHIYRGVSRLLPKRRRLPAKTALPERALFIWGERSDLQEAFDLHKTSGREGLAWWYLRHAFSELGLKFDPAGDGGLFTVAQPIRHLTQHSFLPITWLMRGLLDRANLGSSAAISEASGQEKLLCWFFSVGLAEANLLAFLTEHQADVLKKGSVENPTVPRILACLWSAVASLRERFPDPNDRAFLSWCSTDGAREFPILAHPLIGIAPQPSRRSHRAKPFGVNLFGHVHGRSGLGEDARMAARVLSDAKIPFVVLNVSPGPGMPDEEVGTFSSELPYAINLFAMTAAATAGAVAKMGHAKIGDHYNIGFWPWELPELPEFWHHSYEAMDEIWASSNFTYSAFIRSSPKPVKHMPFAVLAEETKGLTRLDFGLPPDTFLFGFAFDGLSGFARKAPSFVIEAFKAAFPKEDRSVGLVIKGMRVFSDPKWREIQATVDQDDRIYLITESLPRGSLLDLWRSIDCFVSLHRSEGFGRNIAETMLLEKPVIVTAHSGNMDFTNHCTAALVLCDLKSVRSGEYPYGTGQLWAEPRIASASKKMRKIASDSELRDKLAAEATRMIITKYSSEVVGLKWKTAFRKIYN